MVREGRDEADDALRNSQTGIRQVLVSPAASFCGAVDPGTQLLKAPCLGHSDNSRGPTSALGRSKLGDLFPQLWITFKHF